jgi:alanyl-tRNA synthetase
VGAVTLIQESLGSVRSADEVRQLVTLVRERAGSEPVVVAHPGGAGQLARAAAAVLGGGGGGKDDLAQGGGSDVAAIGDALAAVRRALES